MLVATLDWTNVIVAAIGAVGALGSAGIAYANRRALRTPSGDTVGQIAERTHDLAAASVAQNTALLKANGVRDPNGLDKVGGTDDAT